MTTVVLDVRFPFETDHAICVSVPDPHNPQWYRTAYLPKRWVTYDTEVVPGKDATMVVRMPEWLAREKELVT